MRPRTENEDTALRLDLSKPEENGCCNCGWGFLPCDPEKEDKSRYCSHWDSTNRIRYWCRYWIHIKKVFTRITPKWCNEDGTRKTPEQVKEYYSLAKVRERIEKKANPFKWSRARYHNNQSTGVDHRLINTPSKYSFGLTSWCNYCDAATPHSITLGCIVCHEHKNQKSMDQVRQEEMIRWDKEKTTLP